ncbi:hypothetical protein ADL00_26850, partial [Streptomyces sp. AS58]|uniref:thioesterase domain-containing protein n=1 Tax=Streptomyces sp. AS58 TaxID=1519489 RepID=UPI0006C58BC6
PHALIGHSLGELIAATLAEVWTLNDALHLVCLRAESRHEELADVLLTMRLNAPRLRFASGGTGDWITTEQATSVSYWVECCRTDVGADSTGLLRDEPETMLLEIAPGAAAVLGEQPIDRIVVSSTNPVRHDAVAVREALARLWVNGAPVRWSALHDHRAPRRVPLPTSAFATKRYWVDAPGSSQSAAAADNSPATAPAAGPRPTPSFVPPPPRPTAPQPAPDHPQTFRTTPTPTLTTVITLLEETLGTSPIAPDDDFFDLGGDSLTALHLIAKANTTFNIELPHHALLEAPTATHIATHIDGLLRSQEGSASLITLREGAPGHRPLFLFHPVGGSVYVYREFARSLPAGQPVHAFRAAGLHDGAAPRRTVEELADHYVPELRAAQPVGPYALGGAAFGGLVALEVAQRLRAAGETVELLALFNTPGPGQMPLNHHAELSPAESDQLLAERLAARGVAPGQAVEDSARQVLAVYQANLEALYAYRPVPYSGRVLYFLAERRREGLDPARPDIAWAQLALGGLTTHTLPGDYLDMFGSANSETSARIVAAELGMDGTR